MNCPACNCPVNDGDRFCPECGTALPVESNHVAEDRMKKQDYSQFGTQEYNMSLNQDYEYIQNRNYNSRNQKNSNALSVVIITLLSVLIVVVIAVVVLFATGVLGGGSTDTAESIENSITSMVEEKNEETEKTEKAPEIVDTHKQNKVTAEELETKINKYISDYGYTNSVAVSVLDNNTGLQYNSASSHIQFPAWGFYVPIYLAYHNEYGNDSLSYSILSSDPTECNKASNLAIDYLGGTSGITGYISRNFNTSSTSYGRKFGQSVPGKDNYTSAQEAAMLMNIFYNRCSYTDLSYKPSSFGISFPSDASVYSQIGTENLGVKNHLNVFAVVRGDYSDYSIALLTKNGAGRNGFIGNLMTFIHNEMEMAGRTND